MPSGFSRSSTKALFTTILLAFLVLGLFTGGCESRPELAPAPTSGFVGPSNRDKVIVFIHGVTASNEKSWRNPITGAYWPEADPELNLNHQDIAHPASAAHDPYIWVKARVRDAMSDRDLSRFAMLTRAKATPVADNLPPASVYKPLVLAATDPGMVGKASLDTLYRVIIPRLQQGERITSLTFDSQPGKEVFFDFAIAEYLKALTVKDAFRYVVFLEKGRYRGWMSVQRFQSIFHQNGSAVTRLINHGNYAELEKAGMHVGNIVSTATAFEALEYLNRTKEEGIGVLTPAGALVGIASLEAIQSELRTQSGQPI